MRTFLFLPFLLLAIGFQPTPAPAQDGCGDGCTSIEIDDGDGCGELTEEEKAEIRKKNSGLGGQDGGPRNDVEAPKVKLNLQQQINESIQRGVKWLKARQGKDGSWGPVTANRKYGEAQASGNYFRDELGPTAWSVYALAKCDVKSKDPAVRKGLKFIFDETKFIFDVMGGPGGQRDTTKLQTPTRANPRSLSTYESAAIIMMIEAVYEHSAKLTGKHNKKRLYSDNPLKPPSKSKIPKKIWKYMHDRIIHLTVGRTGGGRRGGRTIKGTQVKGGGNAGGWRYGQGNDADLSATQFVLLGLRAASQAGYPVDKVSPGVWDRAASYVRKCQRPSGGFAYQASGGKETGSMAACGIGCLVICKEQIELAGKTPPGWIDDSVKRGLAWLDNNFVVDRNPGGPHHYYYLYGVERVGDLTGRSEFAKKNWYVRGAKLLMANQDASGMYMDATAFTPREVVGTCFALLFLKRSTIPTVTSTGD